MIKAVPNLQIFLILFFASLALILLDSLNLLSLPKQWAFYITNPVSFGLYKSSNKSISQLNFVFLARFAAQENKALKAQLGELLSENATLRKRLSETEAQISQEKYIDAGTYNLIAARPIGLGRYLKIDQGQISKVAQNQAVVVNDNYVGKIIQVSEKASLIQLLTDPDSKVSAFSIGKERRAKGVLLGQFGTDLLMDKILHEEEITVGDLVYSEGTEGFLPRGLILGRVKEVLSRENEIFKQAKVEQIFDIRDLELVFVIGE
ncbi:rod shape-determining protein MreC [Candidatus Daviesbacteria bacterium]|nr:rod shape-determining protein MreC [Candidatus Daviesbacteria bacterium]